MKICYLCKVFKDVLDFPRNKSTKDGLSGRCKQCDNKLCSNWRSKNKDNKKQYYQKNKKKLLEYDNNYRKERKLKDINFKLICNLRTRLKMALKQNNKSGSAVRDLGCTIEKLKVYLESKWLPGMNWSNHGNKEGQWSIDHIIPLSKVDLTNKEQFLKVNHYTNLQPMWHIDNIKKFNKYE